MEDPQQPKPWWVTPLMIGACIALAALIGWKALVVYVDRHASHRLISCQENLVKIDVAKEQYAFDQRLKVGDRVTIEQIVNPNGGTGYLKTFPVEPNGGTYIIGVIGEPPGCTTGLPTHSLSQVGIAITAHE